MAGTTEATGPSYISSHSADVILSDIRPIKLKLEALRSINVLLDEFLFNILNTAREALLEAEVELRAYWDRTARPAVPEDDTQTFHLQWAFELLRLKCEAYSTLNESDEDAAAVGRLQEKMAHLGGTTPPVPGLVAPASLYLTAILEHILSNVGRVAARDSSRTGATVQDVFVALCEDHSIYALFKSMRVYQQIELLSQAPKPRRSKSFSRSDRPSLSQTSNQDLSSSSHHRPRGSTDTGATTTTSATATMPALTASGSSSRSSFDKARMKKLMTGGRNSSDRDGDSQNGHKRSDSVLSDDTKQTLAAYNQNDAPEDTAMLNEFDNLMRSNSTMKVSLTPDRLKTMEVYKQEKDQRGNRRPAPLAFGKTDGHPDSSSNPPSRANGRRPSLRHVDSIVEDEEEIPSKSTPTPRRNNITSPNLPSTSTTSISSTSSKAALPRQSSRSNLTSPPSETSPPLPMSYPKRGPSGPAGFDADPFPVKTRRIQKNRESLDLDAVMAGSDDDEDAEPAPAPAPAPRTPSKTPSTPKRNPSSPPTVSASTRDLMNFLNDGPPEPKVSAAGREMMNFLAQGPPDHGTISSGGVSSIENGKKSSGRLQRMMSKLAMGTSEKSRSQPSEDFGRGNKMMPPTTPVRSTMPPGQGIPHQTSYGNLSSLANRPVPPRPPPVQPISPPSSPTEDEYQSSTRSRKASAPQPGTPRRVMPTWEQQMADTQAPPVFPKAENVENGNGNGYTNGNGNYSRPTNGYAKSGANGVVDEQASSRGPPLRVTAVSDAGRRGPPKPAIQTTSSTSPTSRKPTPVAAPAAPPPPAPAPLMAEDHARDMRRLLAKATNADECRLIFEMFIAKSGLGLEPASYDVPYPSPSSSDTHPSREPSEVTLELSLVELFLGGDSVEPSPRKRRSKKKSEVAPAAAAVAVAAVAEMPAPEPRKYSRATTPEVSAASTRTSTRTHTPITVSEVGA
ncbi:hypothetical protein C8R44DRAFT_776139 [Mycena epipterygia]|nr:hypothetical protein C8R44DRAFT_776139 [Mycena epipterygia]